MVELPRRGIVTFLFTDVEEAQPSGMRIQAIAETPGPPATTISDARSARRTERIFKTSGNAFYARGQRGLRSGWAACMPDRVAE